VVGQHADEQVRQPVRAVPSDPHRARAAAAQERPEQPRCQRRADLAEPEQTTPKQLAGLIRDYWQIENRLHYVRDFSHDEDRCRA